MPPYSLAVDGIASAACGRFRAVCPPSPQFSPSFQQIPHTAFHPSGAASGGVLDLIPAIAVLLALLGDIPELEAQTLCAVLQSPVDESFWDGFDLLFQVLCAGMLLLDLLDALSPPHGAGTPERPGPVLYAAAIVSDGRVVIS